MPKDHFYFNEEIDSLVVDKDTIFARLLFARFRDISKQLGKEPMPVSIDFDKDRTRGDPLFDRNYTEMDRQYIEAIKSGAIEWVI